MKRIIVLVIFLTFFLGLAIFFNIYKKGNDYKKNLKSIEIILSPYLNKNRDVVFNRLKSFENTQKEFWTKYSLKNIGKKERNDDAAANDYLEKSLIFISQGKKNQARETLKKVLLKEKGDGADQGETIAKIKERIKSSAAKDTEKTRENEEKIGSQEIDYTLIDMLTEEFINDKEIGIAKELISKKSEIEKTENKKNDVEKKDKKTTNEKTASEIERNTPVNFYDTLKSSDELKEFVDKGGLQEEYDIVLEVLEKAREDKFINEVFYNKSKTFIAKKIEDVKKNQMQELANAEQEKEIMKKEEELLSNIFKEEEKVKDLKSWTALIGSTFSDSGSALAIAEDGIFITGQTYGSIHGGNNSGDSEVYIMKLNFSGQLVWSKEFGSPLSDGGAGITAGHSGVYITGYTNGDLDGNKNIGNNDVFITKYDFNGNRIWTRLLGTGEKEKASGITIGEDGVYITGNTRGSLDGNINRGTWDVFVAKYDFNGRKIWTRIIGTSNHDEGTGISARGNDIYITGYSLGNVDGYRSKGRSDTFIVKYNSTGKKIWTRTLGSSESDYGYKISAGLDGVYVTGETTGNLDGQKRFGKSDIFVAKYDFNGNKKWTRVLGSSENDTGYSLFVRLDGVYITGGTRGNLGGDKNNGGADVFIAKYDFNGNKKFTKLYGTPKDDICNDIIVGLKFFYLTGETTGNLDGKSNKGGSDIFVMMFSDI